jgi:lipopolysaccharide transport system ATP-binding protein
LIVDEVLAVGDTDFQKKCLGKMDEVSRTQGRTVLFVSHNMEAVLKLCTRGVILERGTVQATGDVRKIVPNYLHSQRSSPRVIDLRAKTRPMQFAGKVRVAKVEPSDAISNWSLPFGQQLSLDLAISAEASMPRMEIGIGIYTIMGFEVASWSTRCNDVELAIQSGVSTFRIEFKQLRLLPGQYSLGIALRSDRGVEDWIPEAVLFEITTSPEAAKINAQTFGGILAASAIFSTLR